MTDFSFGGNWSTIKLEIVRKYLGAYTTILNKHRDKFQYVYIDAFAGTGYQTFEKDENSNELLFPELAENEVKYVAGSARIALQIDPKFDRYVFIEKDDNRFIELQKVKSDYPNLDILFRNVDANDYLTNICRQGNWKKTRAVVFLDPFGMQVKWSTIEAIASTNAIDLWYLFPAGIGVNRLLKVDGSIPEIWREKLNEVFGESNWENIFYNKVTERTLFGEEIQTRKVGDFTSISQYFVNRLETIFHHVAHNPFRIHNSVNSPMYILCFASANATGLRIAEAILKKY